MYDSTELKDLLVGQGKAFDEFKSAQNERFKNLESELNEFAKKAGRPGASYDDGGSTLESREHKQAFLGYMRSGKERDLELKGMATNDDPNGGYLVPEEIDTTISKALRELSPMRQLARVVPVKTGNFSMLHSVGGTDYSWVGEKTDRPETGGPGFRMLTPAMGEIYASPAITQNLLDDNNFGLEEWLVDELAEAFGEGEGISFINGNGTNKPRGILTYDIASTADGTRSESALQYVASGGAGAFAASNPSDKLIKLVHSLKPRYRINAAWTMNTNTLEQIRTFKNQQNDYIWKAGLEAGQPPTLLGYPVYEDQNMPDIASDSLSIAFGDFKRGYVIVDRSSSMLRDPFTAKPHVLFYSTRRVGGGMRDFRAIKLMKFASS
ncbi:HK97 family phage major capsid protein [Nitrosospira sp. Nsp5]|uniref:Phage major capsid protein, HK97 family n=1 Tax=Nitrosospira multiformis TaxID=1231 RepID=A0ABY0T6I7_9PROT|nr:MULTISPECIES: phage major capsid protein [Nitrosospira]PTR07107.1 HK97 family phage major capsid protein [Nitrosospira sp. Nsp5]SDQ33691.1 phage major capsid protein, HK97 family [Nitrosospira multiformis]